MKRLFQLALGTCLIAATLQVRAGERAVYSITDAETTKTVSLDYFGDGAGQKGASQKKGPAQKGAVQKRVVQMGATQKDPIQKNACQKGSCQKGSCQKGSVQKGGGSKCGCSCYLFGPDEPWLITPEADLHGFQVGGWTQLGFHSQQTPRSAMLNDALAFNDHSDRVNLHQQWLWVEKALSGDHCRIDWGFRFDYMYGTDAAKTQAFGGNGWDNDPRFDRNGGYGWAIPQLYAEVGQGDFSVKLGHFYTLVGYEAVTSPDNFFYSHALTMFNTEPFTHTGVLATYGVNENLEVYAGWTAGWDTGFEHEMDGSNFLGGFSTAVSDDVSLTYITTAGNFGAIGGQAYSHSIVADVALSEDATYVFQTDYKRVDETRDDDIGINQYLFYDYDECVGLGARMEWWKDEGTSQYALTGGINYRPHANVVFRPEVRLDWRPFGPAQRTFGMDAIVIY